MGFKIGNPGCPNCATPMLCVYATNCDGSAAVGDTVTITGPGSFSATCTTTSYATGVARCCVAIPGAGSYTVSLGGQTKTVTATSSGGSATFCLGVSTGNGVYVCVSVTNDCGIGLAGIGVSIGGTSATTNSGGIACACVPSGSITCSTTLIPAGYTGASTTITTSGHCYSPSVVGLRLGLASGFGDFCCACSTMAPAATLTLTDNYFGVTATLTPTPTGFFGETVWSGTANVMGATCGPGSPCPALVNTTVTYTLACDNTGTPYLQVQSPLNTCCGAVPCPAPAGALSGSINPITVTGCPALALTATWTYTGFNIAAPAYCDVLNNVPIGPITWTITL